MDTAGFHECRPEKMTGYLKQIGTVLRGKGVFVEAAQERDEKTAPGDPGSKQRSMLEEPSRMTKLPVFLLSLGHLA